jgi:multiple sugar transport system substrate-binding protein
LAVKKPSSLIIVCTVLVLSLVAPAFAEGSKEPAAATGAVRTLKIVGGAHLRNVLTGATVGNKGRNVIPDFEKQYNAKIEWIEIPGDIAETLNRLGPLPKTQEDVIFYTGLYPSRRISNFFEDLTPYIKKEPIQDYPADYAPGMIKILTVDGKLLGLPYRAGTFALWYNEQIYKERGIQAPPRTPEELYQAARQATYTRPDGQKVFGVMFRGTVWDLQEQLPLWSRMWDGDTVTMDQQVLLDKQPVINAVELWRKMYVEQILPGDWATLTGAMLMQHFKDGRVAMITEGTNYSPRFNAAEDSKIRGSAKVAHMPLSKDLWTPQRDFGKSFFWFWNVAILRGSQNKDLAWKFIWFTAQPEIQKQMALNENGPPRVSTLKEQVAYDPGAILVAQQLPFSAPALPPLDDIAEVIDVQGKAIHRVVVDGKPARDEMTAAAAAIKAILARAK